MSFGEYLRQARKARNVTQRTLAESVGIDFTYLSKLENDHLVPPSEQTIWRIAERLDMNASQLFIAARKIPRSLKGRIAEEPQEATELLAVIASTPLSADQYRRMLAIAREEQ